MLKQDAGDRSPVAGGNRDATSPLDAVPLACDTRSARSRRHAAALALLLLAPAPTCGVLLGMNDDLGVVGKISFGACKVWILLFPVAWHLLVDGHRLAWPKWSWRGVPTGAALGAAIAAVILGAAIAAVILGAFFLLGESLIDSAVVRDMADTTGLSSPWLFAAFFTYMVLINSLLEEYVWRWFVYAKCRDVTSAWGGRLAILVSALLFTAHHTVALAAQTTLLATLLGSIGVFIGGAVWSWCYRRFGTLWPAWVSHILADIAIVVIAWRLILA